MRLIFFLVLGVFLWAGTVSIQYPKQTFTITASQGPTCSGSADGDQLLAQLKKGTITSIHDNGQMLTIGLPSDWVEFPAGMKQEAYDTVVCYAQSQHRLFQLLASQNL